MRPCTASYIYCTDQAMIPRTTMVIVNLATMAIVKLNYDHSQA